MLLLEEFDGATVHPRSLPPLRVWWNIPCRCAWSPPRLLLTFARQIQSRWLCFVNSLAERVPNYGYSGVIKWPQYRTRSRTVKTKERKRVLRELSYSCPCFFTSSNQVSIIAQSPSAALLIVITGVKITAQLLWRKTLLLDAFHRRFHSWILPPPPPLPPSPQVGFIVRPLRIILTMFHIPASWCF